MRKKALHLGRMEVERHTRSAPAASIASAHTLRRRLLQVPGRLTRSACQWTLHLPARWPWQADFIRALARIRALPAAA
jgi:hypothetical protein